VSRNAGLAKFTACDGRTPEVRTMPDHDPKRTMISPLPAMQGRLAAGPRDAFEIQDFCTIQKVFPSGSARTT
jgi:hypothetical protein